jgi:hypothetical protein
MLFENQRNNKNKLQVKLKESLNVIVGDTPTYNLCPHRWCLHLIVVVGFECS